MNELNEIRIPKIVPKGKSWFISEKTSAIKALKLKEGDVVELTIKVLHRGGLNE